MEFNYLGAWDALDTSAPASDSQIQGIMRLELPAGGHPAHNTVAPGRSLLQRDYRTSIPGELRSHRIALSGVWRLLLRRSWHSGTGLPLELVARIATLMTGHEWQTSTCGIPGGPLGGRERESPDAGEHRCRG